MFSDYSGNRLDDIQVGDLTGAKGGVSEMATNGQGNQQISEDWGLDVSKMNNDPRPSHLMLS